MNDGLSVERDRSTRPDVDTALDATEQWFVHQGLPHFIAEYTATDKVLPRAVPVLVLSFLVSVFDRINPAWPLWRNAVTVFVGFLVLVGLWAAVNRALGLPALRRPETVGPVEVGVFVFGPATFDFLSRNPEVAAFTVLVNVVQLVVIYVSTSYGLVPMTYWNVRRVVDRVDIAFRLVGRTFPLLLLGVTLLLFNGPMWQTITLTPLPRYLLLLALFVGVTLLFLYQHIVAEFEVTATFASSDEIRRYCANSPLAPFVDSATTEIPTPPAPNRRERTNLLLMAVLGAWEYVAVVTSFVLLFFVCFGLLAIPPDAVTRLVGQPSRQFLTFSFYTSPISVTAALIRVAGFIAVFSGLYLAVHATTDQVFRSQLDGSIREQAREALAVRAVYLTLLNRS